MERIRDGGEDSRYWGVVEMGSLQRRDLFWREFERKKGQGHQSSHSNMGKRKLESDLDDELDGDGRTHKAPGGYNSDEEIPSEVKVIGKIMEKKESMNGKADKGRALYQAFEVDDNLYEVDDAVLITPESPSQKPYVAIIKKIMQAKDGTVQIEGQWFYRPEEADKKGGGTWASSDSRELFYSFHIDEVSAESVMHKCQVHFVPPNKQLPQRHKHPGFIVRRVYDACEKKLFNLTDKDYEDPMQEEIDLLVQKTREALGELPDITGDEPVAPAEEEASTELNFKRKVPAKRTVAPLNLKSEEFYGSEPKMQSMTPTEKTDTLKVETPTSAVSTDQEISTLLNNQGVLTGVHARDRWLEKLVHTIRDLCGGGKSFHVRNGNEGEEDANKALNEAEAEGDNQCSGRKKSFLGEGDLTWPEIAPVAVEVAYALEKLANDSLGIDLHKYNLKMRSLDFNVKNNNVLARRLLSKELRPDAVINMTPAELKDGYLTTEREDQAPPEPEAMQMADVRCSICGEREVGVIDIIHVSYGDRYQLECLKCGNTWYSARDAVSSLVIKTTTVPRNVGIAPWATSKFEEVEKDIQGDTAKPLAENGPAQVLQPQTGVTLPYTADRTGNKPHTDMQVSLSHPPNHYAEVENVLNEHLPVTNPVVEDFVNANLQQAVDTEDKQSTLPQNGRDIELVDSEDKPSLPEPHSDTRSELEKPHVDGII